MTTVGSIDRPAMVLGQQELAALLAKALRRVDARPDWAVVLEGSLAEGFGNSSSDVDLLLIAPNDAELPTMPSVLFLDGRRIEVRTRSAGQILSQFRELAARRTRPAALGEDLLNRCQRLLGSVVLRHPPLAEQLRATARAELPEGGFPLLVAEWWAHAAQQSLRFSVVLDTLGQHRESADWARVGLVQAVKSWAARRGETYLEPKWLAAQLDRVGDPETIERYWALDRAGALGDRLAFAAELGVTGLEPRADRLTVHRVAGVTTWQTGERVHVLRARRDVFALGSTAGQVWRSIVFGRPMPVVVTAAERCGGSCAGGLLAEFLRLGLIRARWRGRPVNARAPLAAPTGPISPPPSPLRPVLTLGGARVRGTDAVDLLPVPADRFGAAAMNLVWSHIVLENLAEDLAGALDAGQWRSADLAVRRLLLVGLRAVLSTYGVAPLPADTELVSRLAMLPDRPAELDAVVARLDGLSIRDQEGVSGAQGELGKFVALVRRITGAAGFPSSFGSAAGWLATLDIGYDWLRLGAYLDADLPIDEARDLLASGGSQPHVIGSTG